MLAHQPVERGQRGLAIAALAQTAQLQQPRGAALRGREREPVAGRGQRGLVASEAARRVHHHLEGALAHVGRGLLRHQGLGFGERALDEPAGEQAPGAHGALGRARRGHRDPRVGQRPELRLRRVTVGGRRLQPERREGLDCRRLVTGGQLGLAQEISGAADVEAIRMAREHALEEAHRRGRVAGGALHRGGPDQGRRGEPALRRAIGGLRGEAAGFRGFPLVQQAVGAEQQRVVLERRPDPGGIAELVDDRGPVARPVRGDRGRETLPQVGRQPRGRGAQQHH